MSAFYRLIQFLKDDGSELPDPTQLIRLNAPHRWLLIFLTSFFLLMLFFRIHCFSIPMWHYEIDGSQQEEILSGKARGVRGDDWALDLTLALAQWKANPRFPIVNPNIGMGNIMMAPFPVPIRHSVLLLRPTTWGFLIEPDLGFSWMWWTKVLGTFYGLFLLFLIFTRNQFTLSLLGAFFILYSPYFQFWSFHKGEIVFHCLFSLISVIVLLFSKSKREIWIAALLLAWSVAGMILEHLYPPILIVLSYFSLFCLLGLVYDRWTELKATGLFRLKSMALGVSGLIVVGFGLSFYETAKEAIELITHTTYPGIRFLTGGGFPPAYLFSNHFFFVPKMKIWQSMGNICEAADFFHFFPLIALVWIPSQIYRRRSIPAVAIAMTTIIGLLTYFSYIGIPPWLAKWTLMSKVTPNRTQVAIGLADVVLLICFLAERETILRTAGKLRAYALLLWGVVMTVAGMLLHAQIPELPIYYLLLTGSLSIAIGYALVYLQGKKLLLAGLALIFFSYTRSFNPIVRGGFNFIENSPLSKQILEVQKQSPAKWAVYTSQSQSISNLLRMIGVPSLGGYHEHPHFKLWKAFDPEEKHTQSYNQSAFVNFNGSRDNTTKFEVFNGSVTAITSPLNPVFTQLEVKYFLVGKDQEQFFPTKHFQKLTTDIKYSIYKIK